MIFSPKSLSTITYKHRIIFLIVIGILAALLRFSKLTQYPVSLNLDEVAISFNAHSILKTGMDEYGTRLPLAFRSHDDYKAPLYIYLTVLSQIFFGYSDFATRFTSAFAGTLTVILTFFLTKELLPKYKTLPLLASLLLAISPWHIQFSRAAYETNLAVLFNLLAVLTFYKGLKNPKLWIITSLSLLASLYTYHSSKIFLPFLAVTIIFLHKKILLAKAKHLILPTIIFTILTIPLLLFSLTPQGQLRFKGTNVFNTPTLVETNQEQLINQWQQGRELEAKIFHNRHLASAMTIAHGYFSHFTYDFLFHGDYGMPQHHTPNVGLLYVWELPFIIIGAYVLFKHNSSSKWLIISWIVFTPLAASLTWDIPSSVRTEIILPIYQILAALGLVHSVNNFSRKFKILGITFISLVIIFSFGHFLHNYFRIAPSIHAAAWQYGYKQAVEITKDRSPDYQIIHVSTNLRQPQNFWSYYTNYDPLTYITQDGGTVSGGFNETSNAFGNFIFKPIDYSNLSSSTLYVDYADKIPVDQKTLQIINYPDNKPALVVFSK